MNRIYASTAVLLIIAVVLSFLLIEARPLTFTGYATMNNNLFIEVLLPDQIEVERGRPAFERIALDTNIPYHLIGYRTDREWAKVTPDGYLIIDPERIEKREKVRVVAAYLEDNTVYDIMTVEVVLR